MKRAKALRADPEKTRAWEQRSRERAAENAKGRPRKPLRQRQRLPTKRCAECCAAALVHVSMCSECGCREWMAEDQPVVEPGAVVRKPKGRRARAKRKGAVPFKAKRPASRQPCGCGCGGMAAQWHHWLPQQHIRMYVRGLRLPEVEARRLLGRLLRDERNLSALCVRRHMDHEGGSRPFGRGDVPSSAFEFAAALGPEWRERLVRMYPGGAGFPVGESLEG